MHDYSDIGLNNLGFPKDAPIAQKDGEVSAYEFDTKYNAPVGALNYTNLSPDSRAYTAVVSLSGEGGTFNDLQLAFDFVRRQGGGRILVLPGTYTIGKTLTIYADTTLEGLSTTDCIIDFNNTTNNLTNNTTDQGINISNLNFKNSTNTNGAIYITASAGQSKRVTILKCRFDNNTLDIGTNLSGQVRIQHCTSVASVTFLKTTSPAGLSWVDENEIFNTTGLVFSEVQQTIIYGNYIQNPGTTVFDGGMSFSRIINNTVTTGSLVPGMDIRNTNQLWVDNNDFLSTAILGTVTGARITNNRFHSVTGTVHDISMVNCDFSLITANQLSSGTQNGIDGIRLNTDCDNNTILGNYINISAGTPSYAVNIVDAASNNNTVVGNFLNANTADTNDGGTLNVFGNNN